MVRQRGKADGMNAHGGRHQAKGEKNFYEHSRSALMDQKFLANVQNIRRSSLEHIDPEQVLKLSSTRSTVLHFFGAGRRNRAGSSH
jgi:hypothetical protein